MVKAHYSGPWDSRSNLRVGTIFLIFFKICLPLSVFKMKPTVVVVITVGFCPSLLGFLNRQWWLYIYFSFLKLNKFTHLYSYCTYVQMAWKFFCKHVHPNYDTTQDLRFFEYFLYYYIFLCAKRDKRGPIIC